jgi:hypothetical protein
MNGNALQIPARPLDQIGRGAIRLTREPCKLRAVRRALAEPFADLMRDRASEIGVIENRARQCAAENGISGKGVFGLAANGLPKLLSRYHCILDHRDAPG